MTGPGISRCSSRTAGVRDLAGLHAIAELNVGRFIITPNQNLVLADIPAERKAEVAALLQAHRPGYERRRVAS